MTILSWVKSYSSNFMKNILSKFAVELSTLFVFCVYLLTMANGVVHLDSGELAAAASTLGIAHPTGYPLFTILGFIFTKVFFFFPKIMSLNLMASILTAIGYYLLVKMLILCFSKFNYTKISAKSKKRKQPIVGEIDSDLISILSISAGLIIAFSKTFWMQSTSVEVYSLHLALIIPTIYFFLKAIDTEVKLDSTPTLKLFKNKYWLLFPIFLGLSFTNHMTTLLILPAIAVMYFQKFGFNSNSIRRILFLLIPFFAALFVYLYLPISASANPEINWGNPIDFERFKRHVMGWQYQSWIFSSTESASKQLKYFFENLPSEFGYVGLLFAAIGLFTVKYYRRILLFASVLFVTCVLYSINYDIADIDSYFLLAYAASGFFVFAGLKFVHDKFSESNIKIKHKWLLVIPIIVLFINFTKVYQKDNVQFEEYSKSVLESVEPNAIVISYLWDFFVSPSYYLQHVDNFRKDVAVIDKELVRRTWYFNQIKRNFPEIYENSKHEIEAFLPELMKFERNEKYDAQLLQKYFEMILTGFVTKNINHHPIYLSSEMVTNDLRNGQFKLPDSLTVVPDLFLFKVTASKDYHPIENSDYKINFKDDDSYYTSTLRNLTAIVHVNRALYEKNFGKLNDAKKYVELALKADPKINIPNQLSELLN